MAMSESKKRANKKWNDANMKTRYDRVQILVPAGEKAIISEHAKKRGMSLGAFVREAVFAAIESEQEG